MLRDVSAPTANRSHFLKARLLVIGQTALPVIYLAGVAVPYLFAFTFKGTDHCPPGIGCQAPGDVFEGPILLLVLPGMLVTIFGPLFQLPLLLSSFTSLARWRSQMTPALRRWLIGSTLFTLALLVFTLLPPGRTILSWVLD